MTKGDSEADEQERDSMKGKVMRRAEVRNRQYKVVIDSYFEDLIDADDVISILSGTDDWAATPQTRAWEALAWVDWSKIMRNQRALISRSIQAYGSDVGYLTLTAEGILHTACSVYASMSGALLEASGVSDPQELNDQTLRGWVTQLLRQAEDRGALDELADLREDESPDGAGWYAVPMIALDAYHSGGVTPELKKIFTLAAALMFGE